MVHIWMSHGTHLDESCHRSFKKSACFSKVSPLQGGEDAQDALCCRSLSAKEPRIIGLFCGKRPVKIRHPVHLRHAVLNLLHEKTLELSVEKSCGIFLKGGAESYNALSCRSFFAISQKSHYI